MRQDQASEQALRHKVQELSRRVDCLRQRLDEGDLLDRSDAITNLQNSLEELQVAHEELRVQGDELLSTRHQLETERHRYQELFDFAPDGYVITDAAGTIREANRAMARMLQVEQRFLTGKPLSAFVHEQDRDAFRAFLNALRGSQRAEESYSLRLVPRSGEAFDAALRLQLVREPRGELRNVRWLVRDVTVERSVEQRIRDANADLERRVAERTSALESANRTKDRFLAALSHELRTPLTPVLASASGLVLRRDLPREVHDELEMIRRNVDVETRLIDDLLDLTRVAHAKLTLDLRPLDMHDAVRNALDLFRHDIAERALRLDVQATATHRHVLADAARVQQVLWNLIRNAVKFTPPGGTITVRTRDAGEDRIAVDVIDTGIGIDPEVLPRLFAPFEQGEDTVTRHYGGLGLGLSISKALTESHGGKLTACSEGRGRGSRFTITLPLAPARVPAPDAWAPLPHTPQPESAAAPGSAAPELPPAPVASSGRRILLVEDHLDTARVLSRLLTLEGHDVQHAATVAEALHLAGSQPFDLLISDLGLPDGSGTDLIRSLRLANHSRPLPGIALTGYGTPADIAASRDAGFAAHLTKPIDVQRLRDAIAHLQTSAAHRT